MFKKSLTIAAIALTAGATLLPTEASAGDPGLGALVGGVFGAAIGHNVNGHNGAVVGGVLGALTGASIAASTGPYYYGPDYAGPAPAYYPPATVYAPRAPVYYGPAPVYVRSGYGYYSPPAVVYRSRPIYVHHAAPRHPGYDRVNRHGRNEWRDGRDHRYNDGRDHRGNDGYDRRGR